MKKILVLILTLCLLFTLVACGDDFEDYGLPVIEVDMQKVVVEKNGVYNSMEEVAAYIHLYGELPSNYTNDQTRLRNYTHENKISYTGGTFQNREGLLPKASDRKYTEADIGTTGASRGKLRMVFSSDGLVFYTEDHYDSFSIIRFVNDATESAK